MSYVVNGWWYKYGRDELPVCDDCGYTEGYGHAEDCRRYTIMDFPEKLWAQLGNIPINEAEEIELPFLHFEAGTHRETIWHWFEDYFDVSVKDLMEGNIT